MIYIEGYDTVIKIYTKAQINSPYDDDSYILYPIDDDFVIY